MANGCLHSMKLSVVPDYSTSLQALVVNVHDNCFHEGEQWSNILILALKEGLVTEKNDFNYLKKIKGE